MVIINSKISLGTYLPAQAGLSGLFYPTENWPFLPAP